ncbi:MAG: hypothetical protein K9M03_01930 [Kiritimatiellales bacterium]|nr:hypothetical protein [Kiritimatiellales bacterium]
MIISSAPLLAMLTDKVQSYAHDSSRHLICPTCRIRTKLYTLKDGRRKCSTCGNKFDPNKKTDNTRLKQYADLIICFCNNLTAKQASDMTQYHYRLASFVYEQIRFLIASQNLSNKKMQMLMTVDVFDRFLHDSAFYHLCKGSSVNSNCTVGEAPIFGLKIFEDNRIFIDPIQEENIGSILNDPSANTKAQFSSYAGFICRGQFHRFHHNPIVKDEADRLWAWIRERLKKHHGIRKKNIGLYLKELEWKYNNRILTCETQALKIVELMPEDFILSWANSDKSDIALVQSDVET